MNGHTVELAPMARLDLTTGRKRLLDVLGLTEQPGQL